MQRMTGIDPMFIYSDTPETPMEIAYACVFDPSTAPGGYSFEKVRALLDERIPTLPSFRRRLVLVPLGLDHPRWVDDPDFDITNHLHRAALPAPGGPAEFSAMVAAVMGRPLTPSQPPWEMHVIEGLSGGRVGLIAKVHHAVIDGVAGAQLLAQLLDLTPEGRAVTETCPPWLPPRLPSQTRLMSDAVPSVIKSPFRLLRAAREVGKTAVRLARHALDEATGPISIPLGAPATFDTPVCAQRAVSFAELDMAQVRTLKDRYGSTVNEVVLAVCSGALRTHLAANGQATESPLVAIVPVSVRGDQSDEAQGNHLSAMFVPLSNDLQTPLERLRTVSEASTSAKSQERDVGYGPMASLLSEAMPPAIARPIIQLGVRSGILRKLRAGNLMVSNVPGPSFPLYFTGMELIEVYPLGPVVDGVALNITVQSYRESLFVGINACATAVPDLPTLAEAMVDELALLNRMAMRTRRQSTAASARHHRRGRGVGRQAGAGGGRGGTPACGADRPGAEPERHHDLRFVVLAGPVGSVGPVASHPAVGPGWAGAASGPGAQPGRRRALAAEQGPGHRRAGRADRRGRGVPRGQRRRLPRVSRADAAHGDHVRAARLPLRVLHLRHALVRQRGLRPGRRGGSRPDPGPGAGGRDRGHAGGPAQGPERPGPVQRAGQALPGARDHRGRQRDGPPGAPGSRPAVAGRRDPAAPTSGARDADRHQGGHRAPLALLGTRRPQRLATLNWGM